MQETPPSGQFVAVENGRIHLQLSGRPIGTAPAVVLIHGTNGNLRDFTYDLTGRLEADFTVVAVDRPGHGYSDSWGAVDDDPVHQARVLRAAVVDLGITRPIVVGHSYGGAVAMGWALEAPDDTAALVLLAGAIHPWGGGMTPWYWLSDQPVAAPLRTAVAALAPEGLAVPVLATVFAPNAVPEGYGDHFGTGLSMRRDAQHHTTRQVNRLHAHLERMAPDYASLPMPIEMVYGTADILIPARTHAEPLRQAVPTARLTLVEGAGHMIHHAAPETASSVIRRAAERAAL